MKNVKGFDIQFDFSGFKKIADLSLVESDWTAADGDD